MSISAVDVYKPSDDVVAREIEGEIIIVPLVAGIGDIEDELFTLNETGKAIWDKLAVRIARRDVEAIEHAGDHRAPRILCTCKVDRLDSLLCAC